MEAKRILFLDFDGVLATPWSYCQAEPYRHDNTNHWRYLNRNRVQRLETIYRHTRCDIVLSTTWRLLYPLSENIRFLRRHGYTGPIIGQTDSFVFSSTTPLEAGIRGDEILRWLADNAPDCQHWIAIDDDWENLDPITDEHIVKTYWTPPKGEPVGLGRKHVIEAIEKLGGVYVPSNRLLCSE